MSPTKYVHPLTELAITMSSSPVQQLPPGWAAEWYSSTFFFFYHNDHSNLAGMQLTSDISSSVSSLFSLLCADFLSFAETATGRSQWEHPSHVSTTHMDARGPSVSPPPIHGHAKRRQYAAGQTQAYYGAGDAIPEPTYGPVGVQQQPAPNAQLFTPGLAAEQGFAGQQQAAAYPAAPESQFINTPGFGQEPVYYPPTAPVNQLADQFGQMGMGQKPLQLYTTNLLTSPPDPRELNRPPPEIRLPPNSCITTSPYANAEHSYQRCTLNAIPTSSSLLNKSKIPLALVITPYRSVKEGEQPVPLVTDTVIARCRRCRTYINPYVQFIDGGNRCVACSPIFSEID